MENIHSLLKRQMKHHLGGSPLPDELRPFFDAVNRAYFDFDADRAMLERSFEFSSQELMQANADLKIMQAQLLEVGKIQAKYEMQKEFTSTVSHELRTPLASIKSSVDILATEAPGKLTEDQKRFLGRVKSNIDRLARLINDVLDLSKLESGKMLMNFVPFDPQDLVRSVVEAHREVGANKFLSLEMKFGKDLPCIMADKDRLIQVLSNLINNALKFTMAGSVVVDVSCSDGMMRFCVRDTGRGIKQEDIVQLFQKFFQVGGGSSQVGGTGLGLAICKEIVGMHNGRIWVESEFGKGSSFIFTIPVMTKSK